MTKDQVQKFIGKEALLDGEETVTIAGVSSSGQYAECGIGALVHINRLGLKSAKGKDVKPEPLQREGEKTSDLTEVAKTPTE